MKTNRPNQPHNRPSFCKYVSAEVAKVILINKTLRWSSPLLFDDPFDVTRVFAADTQPSEMQKYLIDELIELIQDRERRYSPVR